MERHSRKDKAGKYIYKMTHGATLAEGQNRKEYIQNDARRDTHGNDNLHIRNQHTSSSRWSLLSIAHEPITPGYKPPRGRLLSHESFLTNLFVIPLRHSLSFLAANAANAA